MKLEYRIEHDTMGEVKVPLGKYWGAQTQRGYENFKIGNTKIPLEVIKAYGILKKAAANVNSELKMLGTREAELISKVSEEIIEGKLNEHFPLVVYQTGSGTQTNMNINEVIANRGNALVNEKVLHPNDHVNKSQSSNDTFPTVMHIAALIAIKEKLLPALESLRSALIKLENDNLSIIKIGRTHLQDATPLTLGQEISGWRSMIEHSLSHIIDSAEYLRELALGGTAVGTGINAHKDFAKRVAKKISDISGERFISAENKFHELTSKDALSFVHGALRTLASNLLKIANDIRWLASGPRCGIGEIDIPKNEPGSSIMPGKVNPTQCEAITMVCAKVMGNDTTIGFAASQGNFQLNVFMPVIILCFLESVNLLADSISSFNKNCVCGIQPRSGKIKENLNKSLMLVTALTPYIGYENSAKVADLAHKNNITLKEACIQLNLLSGDEFENIVKPEAMIMSNSY